MAFPAEDILYKSHRLEVRQAGRGWAVFIYAPGSRLSFNTVPHTRLANERQKVVEAAKATVDGLLHEIIESRDLAATRYSADCN
jgi:hypothetical protein